MHETGAFPLIRDRFCGGAERCKFCQFDFRHTPQGAGRLANKIHRDLPSSVCAIHYLTDVTPDTPAFAVVPKTFDRGLFPTLSDAQENLGDYSEVPIYAPAGTCVVYKTDLFHCRWDGESDAPRRTMQEYFYASEDPYHAAVGWVLTPERLVNSPDPATRAFYSARTAAQEMFAADGYTDQARQNPAMVEKFGAYRGNGGMTFPPPPKSKKWR